MARLSVASWIGNAAAVMCGSWGAVSRRAREAGCSRQTVYEHAARVEAAVADLEQGGTERQQLRDEVQRVRQENGQLWEALDQSVDFSIAQQQRFLATASAMGLSLTQVLSLLAIVLPAGQCPSRATLGCWLATWSARAGRILQVLDRTCKELVVTLCIDEIFFRRQPVLVGVEPHSMAWVIGRKEEDRKGQTWQEALRPWSQMEYAVADAGTGLRKGLSLIQEARQDDPNAPRLEVGLDVFHIKKEALPVIRRGWQKLEAIWEKAEQADREVARLRQRGEDARGAAIRARHAWEKAEKAFQEAERIEAAWQRAAEALGVFRPDGQLNDRTWAKAEIHAAIEELSGSEWSKVRRMLSDPCALTFLDRLHRQLREVESNEPLREALLRLWWLRRQRAAEARSSQVAATAHAAHVIQTVLCEKIDPNWRESYRRVARVLLRTVRASSVVECMNSVIRMHQARHRTLTQPLLDLKRLWWNCRTFREGKRRGRSPYQHLGLQLPTCDFWELLQMDPEDLLQKVSTHEVAL